MRLWSLHPSLLDPKGLVALWRESLLAQKVLLGQTKGYRSHPQLERFRRGRGTRTAISAYLWAVHDEAIRRGYSFNSAKITGKRRSITISVTEGQLEFEFGHLKRKLRRRDPKFYRACLKVELIPHPIFSAIPGEVEPWERGS